MPEKRFICEDEILAIQKERIRRASQDPLGDPVGQTKRSKEFVGRLAESVAEGRRGRHERTKQEQAIETVRATFRVLLESGKGQFFSLKDVESIVDGIVEKMAQEAKTSLDDEENIILTKEDILKDVEVIRMVDQAIFESNLSRIQKVIEFMVENAIDSNQLDPDSLKKDVFDHIRKFSTDISKGTFEKYWDRIMVDQAIQGILIEYIVKGFESEQLRKFFREAFGTSSKLETMKIFMENKDMIDAIATDEFWKSTRFLFELFFKSKNSQSKQIVGVMRKKYTEGKVESGVFSASEGLDHFEKVLECLPLILLESEKYWDNQLSNDLQTLRSYLEIARESGRELSKDEKERVFGGNGLIGRYVEGMVRRSLGRVVDFIDQFPHVLTPRIVETYTKDITDLWLAYSTGSPLIILETPRDIEEVRYKMKKVVERMESSK